jgi:hypothetical protein
MFARSMIAGAALLVLAAGCAPRATSPASLGELPDAKSPLRLTEKRYTDDAGRTLELRFDGAEKGKAVQAKATDKEGKPLDVVEIPLKDVTVCLPKRGASSAAGAEAAKPLCQPAASMSDGSVMKLGTATCTCYVIGGKLYCFGDTCH